MNRTAPTDGSVSVPGRGSARPVDGSGCMVRSWGGARRRLLGPWGTLKLEFGMDLGGFEVCGCEYTEGFLVLISSDIVTQFDKRL